MHPLAQAELDRQATGDKPGVPFRATTGHLHHTWARTFSSLPELYIQPESIEEIEKAVDLARRCRRRLATIGCGHSPSEITCTSNWMLNLDHFDKVLSIDKETCIVTVESGIRLETLCQKLADNGLDMPNLGSISEQSIAGAISTGTHGGSRIHGLLSEHVVAMRVTLADGTTKSCSTTENPELFRGALLSCGALGIISEISYRAVPSYNLSWQQTIDSDSKVLDTWDTELWTQSEFTRVWWFPYTRRAVIWQASRAKPDQPLAMPKSSFNDGPLGYYAYLNLLYLTQWFPKLMPWVEWFASGMQFGFANGSTVTGTQPSRDALLLNCLYEQFVNEWAIPLDKGPEVLGRLASWLHRLKPGDPDYVDHKIPFSAEGIYVHAPVEVRVSDTTIRTSAAQGNRPYLDPTMSDGPTLFLNATLYRPYLTDPACRDRYYEAFEWLMREMGGRPHWAKCFHARRPELEAAYGNDLEAFRKLRDEVDPDGLFVGQWHRERLLKEGKKLAFEEVEESRKKGNGGLVIYGTVEA